MEVLPLLLTSCYFILLTMLQASRGNGPIEYCHFETFRAFCPEGEVILMKSAFYGRKSIGRCVRTNFGFIGCFSNVLEFLDRRCSGMTQCEVEVIEPNFEDIHPCNDELKSYLEAEYVCLKVADTIRSGCEVNLSQDRVMSLPRLGVHACGTESSPWLIRSAPGQRINVTLYEFSTGSSLSSSSSYSSGTSRRLGETYHLGRDSPEMSKYRMSASYGRIMEPSLSTFSPDQIVADISEVKKMDIAPGAGRRENHVTTSHTSDIRVVLSNIGEFLLTFSVLGCADLDAPEDTMEVRYSADRSSARVICRHSDQIFQLACGDNGWLGSIGNCTSPLSDERILTRTKQYNFSKVSTVIVTMIVVGVSASISLCVLVLGLIILRRFRRRETEHVVMSCGSRSASGSIDRHLREQILLCDTHEGSPATTTPHKIPPPPPYTTNTGSRRHRNCPYALLGAKLHTCGREGGEMEITSGDVVVEGTPDGYTWGTTDGLQGQASLRLWKDAYCSEHKTLVDEVAIRENETVNKDCDPMICSHVDFETTELLVNDDCPQCTTNTIHTRHTHAL